MVHHFHQFNICHLILVVLSTSSSTPKVGVFFIPPLLGVCFYQILVVISNFIDYFAPYFGDYFQFNRLFCTVFWWFLPTVPITLYRNLVVIFISTDYFPSLFESNFLSYRMLSSLMVFFLCSAYNFFSGGIFISTDFFKPYLWW